MFVEWVAKCSDHINFVVGMSRSEQRCHPANFVSETGFCNAPFMRWIDIRVKGSWEALENNWTSEISTAQTSPIQNPGSTRILGLRSPQLFQHGQVLTFALFLLVCVFDEKYDLIRKTQKQRQHMESLVLVSYLAGVDILAGIKFVSEHSCVSIFLFIKNALAVWLARQSRGLIYQSESVVRHATAEDKRQSSEKTQFFSNTIMSNPAGQRDEIMIPTFYGRQRPTSWKTSKSVIFSRGHIFGKEPLRNRVKKSKFFWCNETKPDSTPPRTQNLFIISWRKFRFHVFSSFGMKCVCTNRFLFVEESAFASILDVRSFMFSPLKENTSRNKSKACVTADMAQRLFMEVTWHFLMKCFKFLQNFPALFSGELLPRSRHKFIVQFFVQCAESPLTI